MHFLVGFVIIVTLVAIGFGGNVAQSFVRGTIYVVGFMVFAFVVWLAADTWSALRPMQSRTQATTGYAINTYFPPRTCVEWTNWRPTTIDNCKKWSDGSPTTVRTSAPLSNYATSCWKWSAQDKTMVPVGCDDADALTGPPGGEPRCGAACAETAHSDTNVRRAAK
jgi:hypothetical protein